MKIKARKKILKGVSLFSSAGIGETFFKDKGINVVVANELIEERAKLYSSLYKDTKMIVGDITNKKIFNKIIHESGENIDFLIATPPCQGISIAGKNRTLNEMLKDERNHLVFKIIDFINIKKPNYILIENVSNFLKLELPFKGKLHTLLEILNILYGSSYDIEARVLDASEYGVPQKRKGIFQLTFRIMRSWLMVKYAEGIPSVNLGEGSRSCEADQKNPNRIMRVV